MRKALLVFLLLTASFSAWWDSSFQHRKEINVSASSATDVEILLNVSYEGEMQSDYSDLRFTWLNSSSSSEQELPYWIENYTAASALVWVRVPELYNGNTTLYVYYGNPSASSASNGTSTFHFFDDFEGSSLSSAWQEDAGLTYSLSSGTLTVDVQKGAATPLAFDIRDGYTTEARVKFNEVDSTYSGVLASPMSSSFTAGGNANADSTILYMRNGNNRNLYTWIGDGVGSGYDVVSNVVSTQDASWYVSSIEVSSSGVSLYLNGNKYSSFATSFSKPLNWLRIGYFAVGSSSTNTQSTTYDWVRVRKNSPDYNATFGSEETAYVAELDIISPKNGSFVEAPANITFSILSDSEANVSVFLDEILIKNITAAPNGTQSFSWDAEVGNRILTISLKNEDTEINKTVEFVVLPSEFSVSYSCDNDVSYSRIAREVWDYLEEKGVATKEDIETLSSEIGDVKEGLDTTSSLVERLDQIEQSISSLAEDVRTSKEVNGENLSTLREKLESIELSLGEIRAELSPLSSRLSNLEPEVVSPEELETQEPQKDENSFAHLAGLALAFLTTTIVGLLYLPSLKLEGSKKFKFRRRK